MRRTPEQALRTRSSILLAAVAIFSELGHFRSTLSQIAARAGVTRGAVYFHFKNRRDLFNAVCHLVALKANDGPSGVADAIRPLEQLREMVTAWVQDLERDALKRQVLDLMLHKIEWTPETEDLRQELRSSQQQWDHRVRALLQQAHDLGQFNLPPGTDAAHAACAFQAALLGLVSHKLRHPADLNLPRSTKWLLESLFP